jgi:hypothetical protein
MLLLSCTCSIWASAYHSRRCGRLKVIVIWRRQGNRWINTGVRYPTICLISEIIFCKRQISIKLFYLYQRLQCRDKYFFKIKFVFFIYLRLSHRNHMIWRTKITKFWRNGNDSKQPYWPSGFGEEAWNVKSWQNFVIFVRQIMWFRWNSWHWTSGVNAHNKNSNRYVPF